MLKNPFEKFLVYAIKTGLFAVLFLPLLVTDSFYFPYITGKNFVFRIIIESIFFFYLVLILRNKDYRPKLSIIGIVVSLFLAATAIATFAGVNPYHSFWGNYERMIGLIGYVHLFIFFLILISILKEQKEWLNLFSTSVFVSVLASLYALAQKFEWFGLTRTDRLDATFGNPIYLGTFIILNIFFIVYFLIRSSDWSKIILWSAVFVLEFYVMLGTLSRGPILGFVGGILLFLILNLLTKNSTQINSDKIIVTQRIIKIFSLTLFIILSVSLILIFTFKNYNFVKNNQYLARITNFSLQDASLQSRLTLYGIALNGIKERPLFGWGPENFYYLYNHFYNPIMYFYQPDVFFDRAHNMLVDVTVESGIIGISVYFLLFIFAIYAIIKMLKKRENNILYCAIAGTLFGYFIQNLSVFDNLTSFVLFFMILAYLNFSLNNTSSEANINFLENKYKQKAAEISASQVILITFFAIFLIYFLYTLNIEPMMAANYTVQAYQTPSINGALDLFKQATDLNTFGNPEIGIAATDYFFKVSAKVQTKDQQSNEVKNNFENFIIKILTDNLKRDPQEFKTLIVLARAYQYNGDYNGAVDALLKAIPLSPKKQSTYTQLAETYAQGSNYDKAISYTKMAIDIEPSNKDPHFTLAMIYLTKKNLSDAQNQFQTIKNITEEQTKNNDSIAKRNVEIDDLSKIAKIYTNFSYPNLAEPLFKQIINLNPNNAQAYFDFAYFYNVYGQKQSALNILNTLLARDPSKSQQVSGFIQQFNLLK